MQHGALSRSTQAIRGAFHGLSTIARGIREPRRGPHQRLVRHVLPIAVFELDQKARRAVVVDDLALENAVACAARWIERSEELLSHGIVGDARRRASGRTLKFLLHRTADEGEVRHLGAAGICTGRWHLHAAGIREPLARRHRAAVGHAAKSAPPGMRLQRTTRRGTSRGATGEGCKSGPLRGRRELREAETERAPEGAPPAATG